MRNFCTFFICATAFIILPCNAEDNRAPTDTELRAAYCKKVLEFDVYLYQEALDAISRASTSKNYQERLQREPDFAKKHRDALDASKAGLEKSRLDLKRLNLYILPRILDLDPNQVVIALRRAEEDLAIVQEAAQKCMYCSNDSDTQKCLDQCRGANIGAELKNRLDRCRELSWIPF